MWELIEAAQALEACIGEGHQGLYGLGKKRDINYSANRPPLLKKGKSGMFNQFKKKWATTVGSHLTNKQMEG